jgi:hypothetical protein
MGTVVLGMFDLQYNGHRPVITGVDGQEGIKILHRRGGRDVAFAAFSGHFDVTAYCRTLSLNTDRTRGHTHNGAKELLTATPSQ